jgi:hypothetical protein
MMICVQFDPAIQRFMAMRATNFDHFKVTPKTTWLGFAFVVIPVTLLTYFTIRDQVQFLRVSVVVFVSVLCVCAHTLIFFFH